MASFRNRNPSLRTSTILLFSDHAQQLDLRRFQMKHRKSLLNLEILLRLIVSRVLNLWSCHALEIVQIHLTVSKIELIIKILKTSLSL